jgi:hypothetical protein
MNDGRFISSYVRSRVFDQYIRNINNINNAQNYKHFLQNNGDQIINNSKAYLRENNTCKIGGSCVPMSEPVSDIDFNEELNDYFYQITNPKEDISSDTVQTNHFDNNLSTRINTSENLSNDKVQNLNRSRYQDSVEQQQQINTHYMKPL